MLGHHSSWSKAKKYGFSAKDILNLLVMCGVARQPQACGGGGGGGGGLGGRPLILVH